MSDPKTQRVEQWCSLFCRAIQRLVEHLAERGVVVGPIDMPLPGTDAGAIAFAFYHHFIMEQAAAAFVVHWRLEREYGALLNRVKALEVRVDAHKSITDSVVPLRGKNEEDGA